jgi:hypothetical protein
VPGDVHILFSWGGMATLPQAWLINPSLPQLIILFLKRRYQRHVLLLTQIGYSGGLVECLDLFAQS